MMEEEHSYDASQLEMVNQVMQIIPISEQSNVTTHNTNTNTNTNTGHKPVKGLKAQPTMLKKLSAPGVTQYDIEKKNNVSINQKQQQQQQQQQQREQQTQVLSANIHT